MSLVKRLVQISAVAAAAVYMYEGALSLEKSREASVTLANLTHTTENGVSETPEEDLEHNEMETQTENLKNAGINDSKNSESASQNAPDSREKAPRDNEPASDSEPLSNETVSDSESSSDETVSDSESSSDETVSDSESLSDETASDSDARTAETSSDIDTESDTDEQAEILISDTEDGQSSYKVVLDTEGLEIGSLPRNYYEYSDEKDSFRYLLIPSFQELRQDLNDMIGQYEGCWSIYVKDLKTSISLTVNDQPQDSASLIKLYIAGAVLEAVRKGELEETETIDQLLSDMISFSDNEASNELVRYLSDDHNHQDGLTKVNDFIQRHGFSDTRQYNGLEDPNLWYGDEVNVTSVKDCGRFLEEVYTGTLISHLASRQMEGYLLNQDITWKIPAGIPSEIKTANKTGEKDNTQNDVSLVYTPYRDYILCVMATDITDEDIAVENIRAVSGKVYEFLGKSDQQLRVVEIADAEDTDSTASAESGMENE